jgi:hypothetical protein
MLTVSEFGTNLKQIGSNLDELQGLASCCGRARAGRPAARRAVVAGRRGGAAWPGGAGRRGAARIGAERGGGARPGGWARAAAGGGRREGENKYLFFAGLTQRCRFAV